MLKIGISSSIRFWDLTRVFGLADFFGIGVEIVSFRWHTVKAVKELRRIFPKVKILGIHAPFWSSYKQNLDAIFRLHQKPSERIMQSIWLATMGVSRDNPAVSLSQEFKAYLNCHPQSHIKDCTNIENITKHELDTSIAEVKAMAKRSRLRTTFDTSHAAESLRTEREFIEAFNLMNPNVIHLSDCRFGKHNEHLVPGEGQLPLKPILKLAKERSKKEDINIILELNPIKYRKGLAIAIDDSLKYINKALE